MGASVRAERRISIPEQNRDRPDQDHYKGFKVTEAAMLQQKDQEDVEAGDDHSGHQRNPEEKLKRNGRSNHLRQIAGGNGDLGEDPEGQS